MSNLRLLCLDVGERRIGLAMGDMETAVAVPIGSIDRDNSSSDYRRVADLAHKRDFDSIIVGMPYTVRGEMGPQAMIVEEFIRELESYVALPITPWDERFTSVEADQILRRPRPNRSRAEARRYNAGVQDATAAVLILQGFLDSRVQIQEGL